MTEKITKVGCVFCNIVLGRAPVSKVCENEHNLMFIPLNPVAVGHVLVIPKIHTDNFLDCPNEAGKVMQITAEWIKGMSWGSPLYESVNVITSVGEAATQTIGHFHVHVVPRTKGDGLTLPWTGQGEHR